MTLHLERTSPPEDYERACDIIASIAPTLPRAKLREAVAVMFKAEAPMELRVGSPDAPPLLVVYPTTRAEGERRIAQDKRRGEWMVTKAKVPQ